MQNEQLAAAKSSWQRSIGQNQENTWARLSTGRITNASHRRGHRHAAASGAVCFPFSSVQAALLLPSSVVTVRALVGMTSKLACPRRGKRVRELHRIALCKRHVSDARSAVSVVPDAITCHYWIFQQIIYSCTSFVGICPGSPVSCKPETSAARESSHWPSPPFRKQRGTVKFAPPNSIGSLSTTETLLTSRARHRDREDSSQCIDKCKQRY